MWRSRKSTWLVLFLIGTSGLAGDEKWADSKTAIPDGCIFWLDAARQPAAWQANNRQLFHAAKVDVCYDASGNGLHFMQRIKDAQPQFVQVAERAVIRFDGKDDFLELTQPGRSLDSFTAFIVVSPRSNAGLFRAFLAAHEAGKNDYTTGFNMDMSGVGSDRFSQLNIEGCGFGGATNLLKTPMPFGDFHLIDVICQPGEQGVSVSIDGQQAGTRRRDASQIRLDGMSLGARCYSNSAEPPFVSGFLEGDVAEVLLFDRVLRNDELASLRKYLTQKHAGLTEAIASADRHGGRVLKPIDNAPPVQMLVPGFTVREIPIDLTNINNVRYREDGKLFAVAYDGNIYLLSDTDGDGLEDRSDPFWVNNGRLRGPIGIALTPPGYSHGAGLFVASKGKLSLIVDTDGDNRADREIVVANGWKEIPQNVDAIGVARAKDGSIYFGLGTANYANGYLIDPQGSSQFDIASERGTILRVVPDFSRREIVCTGVRFPVSLAFNRQGDLFATDQEGATWLPNGNPFDELLHIQPGRHYGFPPRHPRHLPGVIDEPSVFDYAPQHQSTCGMFFNDPANGGASFGPAQWVGDAIVCGESRGKLFRTKLAKTAAGYVAINQTIACLEMLTVDACLAPDGDVVVACHSGPPDWGTGPQGKGKLFRIRYDKPDAAQPVSVWCAGPQEVRIEFDRSLDPTQLKNLARQVSIEFGPYVGAGDRFETLKPPYAIVQRQSMTPRFDLPVYGAQVTPNGRTLVLATARHTQATHYAVTLPGIGRSDAKESRGELLQVPAIDLSYDLAGVAVDWTTLATPRRTQGTSTDATLGTEAWSGWLPHMDLRVAREFTRSSIEHERLWQLMATPGTMRLRTQLDLWGMLQPSIQPGSSIDWTPPAEHVALVIRSSQTFQLRAAGESISPRRTGDTFVAELKVSPREHEPLPVELSVTTGSSAPQIEIAWTTSEDSRPRPLPTRRFLLPWITARPEASNIASTRTIPELAGGDWLRGRTIFMGDELACSKCHILRGHGGRIGPDLSNLPHRDYRSVLRDILEPSAAINPDHINYSVAMKDGRVLSGVPLASDDKQITIGDITGKELSIARTEIDELKPSTVSAMPGDLAKKLTTEQIRDLMTFLLTEPLDVAPLERRDAPPPRRRQEVETVLRANASKNGTDPDAKSRSLQIVLVAGPKDHGPDEHDYPLWQSRWAKLLALAENVEISQANGWPTPEQLGKADVIAFYSANPAWNTDRAADLDAFLNRGGGLVYIHFAVNGGNAAGALAERIGMAWGRSKFRHGPLDLAFTNGQHPITRGFDRLPGKVHFEDESYWSLVGDPSRINVLATTVEEGQPQPLIWSYERGRGRVFVSILGHYTWTFDDPLFRILILRGVSWAAGEPVDRFAELATIGARVEP